MLRWPLIAAAYLWAGPYTCLGISLGWLLGGKFEMVSGVVEIHGPRIAFVLERLLVPALAITLGHTVLGQNDIALVVTRTHERVHVRQYSLWGPLFVPAYALASLVLWIAGRDWYRDNPFEKAAYAIDRPGPSRD